MELLRALTHPGFRSSKEVNERTESPNQTPEAVSKASDPQRFPCLAGPDTVPAPYDTISQGCTKMPQDYWAC